MPQDTALLIVDAQSGMLTGEDAVYQSKEILTRLRTLIERARASDVLILYVQHAGPEGSLLARGTDGWQIHPAIAPCDGETIIHKRHPDSFQDTPLQQALEAQGIRTLVIAGLQTEMCIDTTCRRAYSLGYDTILVADAHSTWSNKHLSAAQIIAHHNYTLGDWFTTPRNADNITFDTL